MKCFEGTRSIWQGLFLCAVLQASGCSALMLIPSVDFQHPEDFPGLFQPATDETVEDCPKLDGKYRATPLVKTYNRQGKLESTQIGKSYEYLYLFRLDKLPKMVVSQTELKPALEREDHYFQIDTVEDGLSLLHVNATGQSLLQTYLVRDLANYQCLDGFFVTPESRSKGGPGSYVDRKIYRHARKTIDGNLMFYEQNIKNRKVSHVYYIFQAE